MNGFSEETLQVLLLLSHEIASQAGGNNLDTAREFDIAALMAIFNTLAPILGQLFALCKKPVPDPTPVPVALVAKGVSQETWDAASRSHFGATEGYREGSGKYTPKMINTAAKKLAEEAGTKKKFQKPAAVGACETSRNSTPEALAIAWHEMQAVA